LKKLYNELRTLEKSKTRKIDLFRKRERDFEDELNNLFDIAHASAIDLMKIQEDKDFLQFQRKSGRLGCMMGVDMKLTGAEPKKLIKNEMKNKKLMPFSETSVTGNL